MQNFQRDTYSQSLHQRRFEQPQTGSIADPTSRPYIKAQPAIQRPTAPTTSTSNFFCPQCPCNSCTQIRNVRTQRTQPQQKQQQSQYQSQPNNQDAFSGLGDRPVSTLHLNQDSNMGVTNQKDRSNYMLNYQTQYRNGVGVVAPVDFNSHFGLTRDKFQNDHSQKEGHSSTYFQESVGIAGRDNHVLYDRPEFRDRTKMMAQNTRVGSERAMGVPSDTL